MLQASSPIGAVPPWAFTAEKIDAMVERLVAAASPLRLQKALRGVLIVGGSGGDQ